MSIQPGAKYSGANCSGESDSGEHRIRDGMMHRREAIKRVSLLFGGVALVGGSGLLTACARETGSDAGSDAAGRTDLLFNATDVAYLDEIADTILPDTGTPGAKAAQVGAFINVMVTDAYTPANQEVFRAGMTTLNAESQQDHGVDFMAATPAQRLTLLQRIDREAKAYMDTKQPDAPAHYFRMMKELTLVGYFTSEIGYTKAMRYVETPGRFDPCVPHRPGETIWAGHA